jgi:hypothetical protein
MGLNHRPPAYQTGALPTELVPFTGALGRHRTCTVPIKSRMLCQLSYEGTKH